MKKSIWNSALIISALTLSSCGGGDEPTYTVSGRVTGLNGTLIIRNNEVGSITIKSNKEFTFERALKNKEDYEVTVYAKPATQTCKVTHGKGTINNADITNVVVKCTTIAPGTFVVGGTVIGLVGSATLQESGLHDTVVSSNGHFEFSNEYDDGYAYNVTVSTQPAGQICTVEDGTGTIHEDDITNIIVRCSSDRKIFLTAGHTGGFVGGVTAVDAYCMADPSYPSTGTYKALITAASRVACTTANCSGGPAEHTNWVLQPNTRYVRLNGTTEVGITTPNAIFTFPVTNGISGSATPTWTGIGTSWVNDANNCTNWTSSLMGVGGRIGRASFTDDTLVNWGNSTCDNTFAFYCVEQ